MENNTESKKMTFLELLRMEGINKIKIPRIQRNYAQGREKENNDMQEQLKKFTYETRDTAKEFCEELSQNSIKETNKNMKKIADKIRNQKWYFLEWDKDPTINSMLLMLNEIECDKEEEVIEILKRLK